MNKNILREYLLGSFKVFPYGMVACQDFAPSYKFPFSLLCIVFPNFFQFYTFLILRLLPYFDRKYFLVFFQERMHWNEILENLHI